MKAKKTNSGTDFSYDANLASKLNAEEPISKTQLKAEADDQQALGVRLTELPKDKLLKLDLPEAVLTAVLDSKKITANGAIRRHKQYLGHSCATSTMPPYWSNWQDGTANTAPKMPISMA